MGYHFNRSRPVQPKPHDFGHVVVVPKKVVSIRRPCAETREPPDRRLTDE